MSPLRRLLPPIVALVALVPASYAGTLVSGPMLGAASHREGFVWVEVRDARTVALDFWPAGQPAAKRHLELAAPAPTPAGGQIVHLRPGLLEPGTTYEYALSIDGQAQEFPYPTRFRTLPLWQWRGPAPDFKFIYGSCAFFNEPAYDRPGPGYGKTMETFRLMGESGADFMIWGGDNWYYREVDFDSRSGLWSRAQRDRAWPELRRLLAAMPHYATWDDHDYGPNDANRSYGLKDETLAIFKAYWGNPSYGLAGHPGVYTHFLWGDAAFILMDDRWDRDDDKLQAGSLKRMKTQYGEHQRDWLKQALLAAEENKGCVFKFIVTGGQVITDFGGESETFAYYPEEREDLLRFIADHHITGVIFLSGDVHFTELARKKLAGTQWVYELTSSPFSSGAYTRAVEARKDDPHRVAGSFVCDQNFCLLEISGPTGDRAVTITCVDKQGAVRFTHTIRAAELR